MTGVPAHRRFRQRDCGRHVRAGGEKISFMRFVAYGLPIMLLTVFISMSYIRLRYYLL